MPRTGPVGTVTRGTTNPNRLRRCDRWLAGPQGWRLRASAAPLAVDLGYGGAPWTAVELCERLTAADPRVRVVGIEIDPARVALGAPLAHERLSFALGGFEVPLPGGRPADVIRAFNVLRQYPEDAVPDAWDRLRSRLTPTGLLVDGTCDEIGRIASWVAVDAHGPRSLTVSLHLRGLARPGIVAERLPKALIHRNVPGERVHAYLRDLDAAWSRTAPFASYGARQRFSAMCAAMKDAGWPLLDDRHRWRLGEITVAWDAVAPASGALAV